MKRILNLFDNLGKTIDCETATKHRQGIAARFSNNRMDMNTFKIMTNLDCGGSALDLYIGYLDCGRQRWTPWHVGCQARLTVWFEDDTRVDFDCNKYDTEIEYKRAVYNYFREYIANGFDTGPKLQIVQEVEFMDI